MYGELTLTLRDPVSSATAVTRLQTMIGGNAVAVAVCVTGTPLVGVAHLALCAEQLSNRANIVYFMAGPDTLVANIFAKSISQIRHQCGRISRQFPDSEMKLKKVNAAILVNDNGSDLDIFSGEKVSLAVRWWEALKERFFGKFIPAALTVFLATVLMSGTTALRSAEIGFIAALIGSFIDAWILAASGEPWKWKESK